MEGCMLAPSDYDLPEPGENVIDHRDPLGSATRAVGMVVSLGVVYFAWQYAKNRVAPFLDRQLGSLTGGAASYSGTSGGGSIL
jgi:hypothetical protein